MLLILQIPLADLSLALICLLLLIVLVVCLFFYLLAGLVGAVERVASAINAAHEGIRLELNNVADPLLALWTITEAAYKTVGAVESVATVITELIEPPIPEPTIRVFFPDTLLEFEGANLMANLKNTQQMLIVANFRNRLKGPARIEAGSVRREAVFNPAAEVQPFFLEPSPDGNELRALVRANPESPGDDNATGIVRIFADGDAGTGVRELVAELVVNVTPGDAEIFEIQAGPAEEQPDAAEQPQPGGETGDGVITGDEPAPGGIAPGGITPGGGATTGEGTTGGGESETGTGGGTTTGETSPAQPGTNPGGGSNQPSDD